MGFHSQWVRSELENTYTGAGKNFYFCLADSATLTEFSPIADFFAAELAIGTNGYQRKPVTFAGPALFDNTTKVASLPMRSIEWLPTGGSLQFQTVFLIAGGSTTGTTGSIVFIHEEPQIVLRQAGQAFQFEFTPEKKIA